MKIDKAKCMEGKREGRMRRRPDDGNWTGKIQREGKRRIWRTEGEEDQGRENGSGKMHERRRKRSDGQKRRNQWGSNGSEVKETTV